MKELLWILLFLLYNPFIFFSQPVRFGSPQITNYNSDNYKADDQNWYVFQDKRGVIYTANSKGVLEFDGNRWKLISLANKLGAWRIIEDSIGQIYVAGSSEIGYLASDNNCNTIYKSILHEIPKEYKNFRDIWGFYYFENKIVIITHNKIFILKDGKTHVITKNSGITELGRFNDKLFLYVENEGICYLKNNKLYNASEINKNNKRLYRRLLKWNEQKALLAGKESGLFLLENNKIERWITELDNYFPGFTVYHIITIANRFFAVATVKNGIFIIDKSGKIIKHIDKKNGLLTNTVYYLFLDNQNRLWAGHNKGVSCIEIFSPFTHLGEQNNINGNISTSMIYNNNLYLGGEPYLYYIKWPIENDLHPPQVKTLQLKTGQIYNLYVIDDKLFCSHQKGISIIEKNHENYSIDFPGMCWGLEVCRKKENNILVCTNTEASILEKKRDTWVLKNKLKGHSSFEKALGFDFNDYLWTFVRNEGVVKLKLNKELDSVVDKKLFTHIGKKELDSKIDLYVINQQVFVFMENELYAFNSFKNDFTRVKIAFEGKILQIIAWKELENLWAKTTEGIVHFCKNNEATYYPVFGEYLNFRYLSKTSNISSINDSTLIFMHPNGVSYYHPVKFKEALPDIDARIENVSLINNDSVIFGGTFPSNSNVFSNFQKENDVPILEYQNNSLRFAFTTTTPQVNKEIKYQFKLENFDKKWSKWSYDNSKDYTNLNAGSYTFHVRTKISNHEAGSITSYTFKILPPWYTSNKAYFIYSILLIALILLVYWLNVSRIRKKYSKDKKDFKIDLITNISHEIKTPISLILSPLEEILAKDNESKEKKSLHMLMYRNARRLKQLVNLLLDYRKDEEGSMSLRTKKEDIVQFIEELLIPFEHVAKLNKINYQFKTSYESKSLYFDDQKLEIILTNLLSNAFKYTEPGGSINIVVSDKDPNSDFFILQDFFKTSSNLRIGHLNSKEYIEVSIEDSGSGISKKNMARIFDKFYHNNKNNNLKISNTGLGLAFTEKLIRMHKGEIHVWSRPGYGSRFAVRIAIDKDYYNKSEIVDDYSFDVSESIDNKNGDLLVLPSQNISGNKPCLLLVDDEKDMRIYLRKLFEEDYRIIEAVNGKEAVKILKHNLPDLIISDIKMPEMDGVELCKEIKNNVFTSHIPFLLLTGADSEKNQFDGFESGANQYIAKPFNPNLLKIRAKKLIENSNKLKNELHFDFSNGVLNTNNKTKKENLLVKAAKIINDNLTNPDFNINSLASELNLSRTVFYKKFNECIEITPNEFIQIIRLEKSKSLLDNQELTISEVAYLVGFNDAKYFSTSFKKHFNFSPREYRKSV